MRGIILRIETPANTKYLQNAVKDLIMERFDRAHNNPPSAAPAAAAAYPTPQTNGYSSARNSSDSKPKTEPRAEPKVKSETPASSTPGDYGDDSDVVSPPKKKRKHVESSKELDDATLAAMLQAQENRFATPCVCKDC
jgi:upstream activation factor subunit UAF30